MNWKQLSTERLILAHKQKLTPEDKVRLSELNNILDSLPLTKITTYNGWRVFYYPIDDNYMACQEEKVFRANTKEEIESLVDAYISATSLE